MIAARNYLRRMVESLKEALPSENIPHFNSLIPGSAGKLRSGVVGLSGRWAETDARDRTSMT